MQAALSQLKGKSVKEIHTLDLSMSKYSNAEIVSAENGMLQIKSNDQQFFIPMHLVVGVEIWKNDQNGSSWSLSKNDSKDSKSSSNEETAMGNLFKDWAGKKQFDFSTLAEQLTDITNAVITDLGTGVVVISNQEIQFILALSSISSVSNVRDVG